MNQAAPERDAYLDNARFWLMLLVVVGHAIEPLKEQLSSLKGVYIFLYLFHIPAFAFVSGTVSPREITRGAAGKLLCRIVAPLALFALGYAALQHVLGDTLRVLPSYTAPYKHLWFLLSLLSWRLLLPLFSVSRLSLAVAVALGLLVGYATNLGETLSIGRTLVFFPFFLLGNRIGREPLAALARTPVRLAAAAVLIAALCVACLFPGDIRYGLYFGKLPYADLGWRESTAAWHRAVGYLVTAATGAAFLALVPRRRLFFTAMGGRTLYSYLLHMIPVTVAVAEGGYQALAARQPEWLVVLLLVAAACALHLVLSLRAVSVALRYAVEPSERQAAVALAAVVAVSAALVLQPSINYLGATWISARDVPVRVESQAPLDCRECRDIPAAGVVVDLGRTAAFARLELGLSARGRYRLELFRENRRVLSRAVSTERGAASQVIRVAVDVPRPVAARGYDAVVVTPLAGAGPHRMGGLHL